MLIEGMGSRIFNGYDWLEWALPFARRLKYAVSHILQLSLIHI